LPFFAYTETAISADLPVIRRRGEQWLHEVKFDGWRIQLHKHGDSAAAFTKNGHDHSNRVRWMVDALARLAGVRSLVIDVPNFYRLRLRRLHHKGCDLRELPLFKRKASLEKLIIAANANWQIHPAFFYRGPASPAVDIRQQCRQEAC
jgi:bifunctional non-homologous end joining protein LigD